MSKTYQTMLSNHLLKRVQGSKRMTTRVLGSCGNCGGTVVVNTAYLGLVPPKPHCMQCYAVPKSAGFPVITMESNSEEPFIPVREITEKEWYGDRGFSKYLKEPVFKIDLHDKHD